MAAETTPDRRTDERTEADMTAITILNAVLIATVVLAIVGGLGWSIVADRRRGAQRHRTRLYVEVPAPESSRSAQARVAA